MFLRQKQRFLEEKKLLGRVGTPKKVKISHPGVGIRREKGGVFMGEHKNGFNEPKRLSDGLPRPIIAKLHYHWA